MRLWIHRLVPNPFYLLVGISLVLLTTPGFPGLVSSTAWTRWMVVGPVVGLLVYLTHLFEDAGRRRMLLSSDRGDAHRPAAGGPGAGHI